MTRETKVGLGVAATVFVVVGGALAYKLYFLSPPATQVAQSTTSSGSQPQVVPARSEASSAATSASDPGQHELTPAAAPDKTAPFQPEIRSDPATASAAATTTDSQQPASTETVPPPPPIIITDKPPASSPGAEKSPTKPGDSSKAAESATVRTTVPVPAEPPSSPFNNATTPPTEPASLNKPAAPIVPMPPVAAESSQLTLGSKPAATGHINAADSSLQTPPPLTVTPPSTSEGKSSVPESANQPPTREATGVLLEKPVVAKPSGPSSSSGSPKLPGAATSAAPASASNTPGSTVTVPPPPSSEAFDRSYPAPPPPASLVAGSGSPQWSGGRDNKPKPDDAIPVIVRPQTQPLSPPPPDAYPVKISPQLPGGRGESAESGGRKSPVVLDYEVQRYTAQPGETWESISRRKYGSERFARALAAFNRDRNPGLIAPMSGASILLPPADILQLRYPQLVNGASPPLSSPAATSGANALNALPTAGTLPPSSPVNPGAYKLYRVQPNDTIWLIAKRTLGSGDRWPEILRLNRDVLRDVNQLPPGLVLRLPPDARVDENAPPR